MSAQKHTLTTLVEQSLLLRRGQRQELLKVLPKLTAEQQARLEQILATEPAVLKQASEFTIASASARNDKQFFADLDKLFGQIASNLTKAEEPFEKTAESNALDHFFDAA